VYVGHSGLFPGEVHVQTQWASSMPVRGGETHFRVQVSRKIIDFHLVEKCRTKFRAFVKSYGARVKFEPVRGQPRKQEYHGTVTVNRACKQQWLTQKAKSAFVSAASCKNTEAHAPPNVPQQLQCAAPVPITTGACDWILTTPVSASP
jgi:hypothetical protein